MARAPRRWRCPLGAAEVEDQVQDVQDEHYHRDLDVERGGGAATPLGLGGYEDRGQRQRGGDAGEHRGVTPAMVAEKLCVPFLRPPRRRLAPSTSSTLLMIEAFTTAVRPAERAKIVMMSSAALPKVALRTPPTRGPAWWLNDSVACPRTQASRTRASEVRRRRVARRRGAVRRRPRPSRRR